MGTAGDGPGNCNSFQAADLGDAEDEETTFSRQKEKEVTGIETTERNPWLGKTTLYPLLEAQLGAGRQVERPWEIVTSEVYSNAACGLCSLVKWMQEDQGCILLKADTAILFSRVPGVIE